MAIIRCKMCGADLDISANMTVAECESCGTKQTVPTADNEKKLTLFTRANKLRASCEFDKAAGVYESIVAEFPDEAEAYWGLVLCQYGIEYVDDPATGKKIPTCHRSSFDSVMDDSNFEQAMENADEVALRVYREEAKEIERIRKGILEVSSAEQPYDIFICYKETASNGDRTVDSLLAENIYDALTDKGYRVFFSRITLEGTLGIAFEPYIFAALNSAKIMLAVGTCYEHYNAVWVKNEWSRYLKIIAQDKNKYLIPCYKNIDPYDIPKEFSHLQGQDMGKVGAIQDLLRGIEKILPKQKAETVVQERIVVGGSTGDNKIASLLDRGNMALEDGDWAKADSFFEDVLNNDSKNAQAYLGKTLATEKCRTIDAFARKRKDVSMYAENDLPEIEIDESHIEEMVEKYSLPGYVSKEEIHALYEWCIDYDSYVESRKYQYKAEENYWANHKWLSKAERFATGAVAQTLAAEKKALFAALAERVKTAEAEERAAKKAAEEQFASDLKEADEKAEQLYTEGLACRENYYQELLQIAKTSCDVDELNETAENFDDLEDYNDSVALAEYCRKRAAEEQAKLDAEAERQRLLKEKAERERKAKNKKIGIISAAVVAVIIAVVVVLTTVVIPSFNYKKADALLAEGNFIEAAAAFEALGDYKEAPQAVSYANANYLLACARNRDEKGLEVLSKVLGKSVSFPPKKQSEISVNGILLNQTDLREDFATINEYISGDELWSQLLDDGARAEYLYNLLYMLGYFDQEVTAITELFLTFDGSVDAYLKATSPTTEIFVDLSLTKEEIISDALYDGAWEIFASLGDYRDSTTLAEIAQAEKAAIAEDKKAQAYSTANDYLAVKDYDMAIAYFAALGDYKDSNEQAMECRYSRALALMEARQYVAASAAFDAIEGYKDSSELSSECKYLHAGTFCDSGRDREALALYDSMDGYKESNQLAAELRAKLAVRETLDAGFIHTVGLNSDFIVVSTGYNNSGSCEVDDWTDIIAVSAGEKHTVGLKSDGTVIAIGDNSFRQCNVDSWTDIIAIYAGRNHTVGLKADGTVVSTGATDFDGHDVSGWTDIVAISGGGLFTVGLKSDGTVVATGNDQYGQCNVEAWTDIIAISAGTVHTVGLKSDGTVVSTGETSKNRCNTGSWTDIVAISTTHEHTLGLKSDGTVVATGSNDKRECDVKDWTDIVAISAGEYFSVGLKSDGTVVGAGANGYNRRDFDSWENIKIPN